MDVSSYKKETLPQKKFIMPLHKFNLLCCVKIQEEKKPLTHQNKLIAAEHNFM